MSIFATTKDLVENKKGDIQHIKLEDQTTDFLTKPLKSEWFGKWKTLFGWYVLIWSIGSDQGSR